VTGNGFAVGCGVDAVAVAVDEAFVVAEAGSVVAEPLIVVVVAEPGNVGRGGGVITGISIDGGGGGGGADGITLGPVGFGSTA
jgi:hypothetical protein